MGNLAQRLLGVVFALCIACSSSTAEEPVGSGHGQCAPRDGTYRQDYTTRDGTCGPQTESISGGNQPPAGAQSGCTGPGISYSADNCDVTFDVTCPSDAIVKGGSIRTNGTSQWSVDASYGTVIEQFIVYSPDGAILCSGTYDVVANRQ